MIGNYYIMSGDVITAVWKDNKLTILDNNRLPLLLNRVSDLQYWLETRSIDSHRANSRLLKKALRLSVQDDVESVIYANAATITDNYWIKPIDSSLTYKDIRFKDDYFSSLALNGDYESFNRAANSKYTNTPELTNIGSFEKCWKLKKGKWWMNKRANNNELFSELFVSELGKSLGMNMADYERGKGCIKTIDFTENASFNFEPAFSFMGDNDDYEDVISKLKIICKSAIPDYIKMIFLDTVVANPDRHTYNFGVMRDVNDGNITGLAPNFDNNMALIARGYPPQVSQNDILISLFNEVLTNHPEYRAIIPEINENIVISCIDKIKMKVKKDLIVQMIMSRYEKIKNKSF